MNNTHTKMGRSAAFSPLIGKSSRASTRLFSSRSGQSDPSNVGIIGGGLAGLSTAYHLLQKSPSIDVTIIDKAEPGASGASSVAGGLLHPLSPRGKLVHLGLEGLASTNKLLDTALQYEGETILRNEIYRVALNDEHVSTLKRTGKELPDLTQWKEPEELPWANSEILGSLRLHSGCKVVHVPTYLKGLWAACQSMGSGEKEWLVDADCTSPEYDWEHCLSSFDTVVLCAGAGLFQNSIIKDRMPMQLVRGQSVELSLGEKSFEHAMLCGKYVSPLVEKNRVLVGATHEFKEEPFDASQVKEELKERSYPFSSSIWDDGIVDKITCGFRVQSNRGKYGRIPIIGHFDTPIHANAWVFTGLSSRGLLYHGIYGNMLTDMILNLEEENQVEHVHLDWWRE